MLETHASLPPLKSWAAFRKRRGPDRFSREQRSSGSCFPKSERNSQGSVSHIRMALPPFRPCDLRDEPSLGIRLECDGNGKLLFQCPLRRAAACFHIEPPAIRCIGIKSKRTECSINARACSRVNADHVLVHVER